MIMEVSKRIEKLLQHILQVENKELLQVLLPPRKLQVLTRTIHLPVLLKNKEQDGVSDLKSEKV